MFDRVRFHERKVERKRYRKVVVGECMVVGDPEATSCPFQRSSEKDVLLGTSWATFLFDDLEWAEEVAGVAVLIGVGDEVSVELLVAGLVDAASLLVVLSAELVEGSIDVLDISEGSPGDAVKAVLINANQTVTVDVNGLELVFDEGLEGRGETFVLLALAVGLDSLLEFLDGDFTVLVEISELSNLVPEIGHDLLVGSEGLGGELAVSLDQGDADGKAIEVVLVEEAIVVDVVHVPDDVLDTVIPAVSHFALVFTDSNCSTLLAVLKP